jgi:hypothetical protein
MARAHLRCTSSEGDSIYTAHFDGQRFAARIVSADDDGSVLQACILGEGSSADHFSVNKAQADMVLRLWRQGGVPFADIPGGKVPQENDTVVMGVPAKMP